MKKAVIITGQLRTNELVKWFHKNSFFDDNCDIFLSIDTDNEIQLLYKNDTDKTSNNLVEETIKFYKPKKYYIGNIDVDKKIIYEDYKDLCNKPLEYYDIENLNDQKQKEINLFLIDQEEQYMKKNINIKNLSFNHDNIKKGCLTENSINGLFRQFYFVKKGYELLSEYKKENNINYDIVIRIRFDHILLTTDFINNELNKFTIKDNNIAFCKDNLNLVQNIKKLDLDFDKISNNTINVMGAGVYKKYVYVNDFFWTHGDDLIEKMLKFYEQLHDIISFSMNNFFPIYGAGIEHYFAIFLFKNNIDISQTIMNKCNIIRKI